MRVNTQKLMAVVFVVFLALPALSSVLPIEVGEIENRDVSAPDVSAANLVDPAFYVDYLRYVRDSNPMRAAMVWLATGVDYRVFGDSPNPSQVVLGEDGWMFARNSIDTMCVESLDTPIYNFHTFVSEVAATGASTFYTVVPSKFTVYPELVGSERQDLIRCGIDGGIVLDTQFEAMQSDGYIDSWNVVQAAAADEIYFRTDTHLNYLGVLPWMEAIIEKIAPGLWDEAAVVETGPVEFAGNLGVLVGPGIREPVESYEVDRGFSTEPFETDHEALSTVHFSTERFVNDPEVAPVIPGRSWWLKDSFGDLPRASMAQYFEDLTIVDWRSDDSINFFLSEFSENDTVIVEIVDEGVIHRFNDPDLVDRIRDIKNAGDE